MADAVTQTVKPVNENDDVLHVSMFGTFSMSWHGKALAGEAKSMESQFICLMELLLHYREKGVTKDILERALFEDRDIDDVHHALRSVIYNARKRLKKYGLPDVNYIIRDKGVYTWTSEIPVVEDTTEMERLYARALKEEDAERRKQLLLDACHCYTGEFLGNQIGVFWIAREARKYRELFFECVDRTVEELRSSYDFFNMEALGIYAARLHPLENWELVTMEAMVSMGRYEDACRLYEDTVEMYFREQGLKPSPRLMEMLNDLGNSIDHQYAVLDDIQADLTELELKPGGYTVSYPVFQGIYRLIERLLERGGQSVFLMLCTVVDSKGNPMRDGAMLEELSARLGESIKCSVRHNDTISRYGRGQYLVLLVNTTLENCKIVQKRINHHFIIGRQRTGVRYHVNSVICKADAVALTSPADRKN